VKNYISNFVTEIIKVPKLLGYTRGLFLLPEVIMAYLKTHARQRSYTTFLTINNFSVYFENTMSILSANDLHILQGILLFEKPITSSDFSRYEQEIKSISSQIQPSNFVTPFLRLDKYMKVEDNVVNFFHKINHPSVVLSLPEQIKILGSSLYKLLHQNYTLKVTLNNEQKYTAVNKFAHFHTIDEATGNFSLVRGIESSEEVYNQPLEISLSEITAIKSDATRILHNWLCSVMEPGQKDIFTQGVFEEYLYNSPNFRYLDYKKNLIEEALFELMSPGIDWKIIKIPRDDSWSIQRKNFPLSSQYWKML
jgi:hypothetical protein